MKKFLSLVLALVMTMSLVTIGAGATEYKDLKDKSEIQYEEAVAVLNKLGIITGYEDGSFKPTGALTRGAAAKIIVSLMIGADAASSLTVAAAPYKDVPVTNTFAAVISYCKTAGYINGYSDGTFRPTASLTGYAFAKMLLGALGYKGDVEGFSGSGWTMKVASVGNTAGLYNDFNTPFSGNAGVTREQACQLALNTLKATKVEYTGSTVNVSGQGMNVTVGNDKHEDVANNGKTDGNILKPYYDANGNFRVGKDGKMQFAEQHFTDLKQLNDTTTDFNRPATSWAYKNVTVGKFAYTPDYTFTAAPSGDTAKDKVKDLGLNSYKVDKNTNVSINEKPITNALTATMSGGNSVLVDANSTSDTSGTLNGANVAEKLVNLFGNGILVEIYIDSNTADRISDIVVVRSQMMEVNTVSSKTITVKQLDEIGNDDDPTTTATNDKYFSGISSIKDSDDVFADLKNCKSGDYMLVTYTGSNATKSAYSAKAPTVVTGALTAITRNNENKVNGITVGGTAYKLAAIRDDDFATLNASTISSTKKDVTLYLDAYGYATYIKDAGSSDSFMIYGDYYSTLVNGKLAYTMSGWDMKGVETSINVGNNQPTAKYGDVIKYISSSSSNADYQVIGTSSATNPTDPDSTGKNGKKGYVAIDTTYYTGAQEMKAQDTIVYGKPDGGSRTPYTVASGIKTIFVDFDNDGTVKSLYVKDGVANVTAAELATVKAGSATQLYVNDKKGVEAIVVKTTSSDAVSDKVLYIESVKGDTLVDGVRTYTYHVWVNGAEDDYTSTDNLTAGQFATYADKGNGNYKLSAVTKNNAATSAFTLTIDKNAINSINKNLIYKIGATSGAYAIYDMTGYKNEMSAVVASVPNGNPGVAAADVIDNATLNTTGAVFADLKDKGFSSMKDVYDYLWSTERTVADDEVELTIVMNNKDGADNQFKVTAVAVTGIK